MKQKLFMLALGIAIGMGGLLLKNGRTVHLFPTAEAAPPEESCTLIKDRDIDDLMVKVNKLHKQGYRVEAMGEVSSHYNNAAYNGILLCLD